MKEMFKLLWICIGVLLALWNMSFVIGNGFYKGYNTASLEDRLKIIDEYVKLKEEK